MQPRNRITGSDLNHGESEMDEANHRLQQAPNAAQAASMRIAVVTLAQREAREAVKRQMRAKGLKVAQIPYKVIAAAADGYLAQHPELFAGAKATVDRWHAEGMFNRRGGIRSQRATLNTNAQKSEG
jgi:hypothetical protein